MYNISEIFSAAISDFLQATKAECRSTGKQWGLSRHHCSGFFILTQDSCCQCVRSSISGALSGSIKRSNSSSFSCCRLSSNGYGRNSFNQRYSHSLHAMLIVFFDDFSPVLSIAPIFLKPSHFMVRTEKNVDIINRRTVVELKIFLNIFQPKLI